MCVYCMCACVRESVQQAVEEKCVCVLQGEREKETERENGCASLCVSVSVCAHVSVCACAFVCMWVYVCLRETER